MKFFFIACNKNNKLYKEDASFIYRCDNLAYHLELLGHRCQSVHLKKFNPFVQCDVVVFHRPTYSLKLHLSVMLLRRRGVICLADMDDLVFDPHFAEYSPAYRNGKWSLKRVQTYFYRSYRALALFENFTLSTQPLQQRILSLFPKAQTTVLPNSVHFSWLQKKSNTSQANSSKIISYLPGTKSHDKDFAFIQNALENFLLGHPDVEIHITGPLDFVLNVPKYQVVYKTKVPFAHHYQNYENVWLNIAPLEQNPFTESKSALKVIEAGFFSIPTLCSPNNDILRFSNSGAIIATTQNDWFEALEKLYKGERYIQAKEELEKNYISKISIQKQLETFVCQLEKTNFTRLKTSFFCRRKAKDKRQAGEYMLSTLRLFSYVWKQSKKSKHFLEYVLFRRDLGYPLTANRAQLLKKIYDDLPKKDLLVAKKLLFEYENQEEKIYHKEFATYLKRNQHLGICVVGNAPFEGKQGQSIDSNGIVIRFNNFFISEANRSQRGSKIDIWIKVPRCKKESKKNVSWVVTTSAERFYGVNTAALSNLNNCYNTDIPLSIWKDLVRILYAPPSAGVAILYWIKKILGGFDGVCAIGFNSNSDEHYHHATQKHRASRRHNWIAEQALIDSFKKEGLKFLQDKT